MNSQSHVITTNIIAKWDQSLLFKILDNIQDIVMVLDADTTIVYINYAYAKELGVPVSKVLGRKLIDIEPDALAIEILRTGLTTHNRRDKLVSLGIDVIGSGFPLFEGGKIVGCVSIFNNISEVVQLNHDLKRSNEVADYLQKQLNQLEQIPLSFKEFAGCSPSLWETLALAVKVAPTDSTVMILGESGVGKGVLARAIHNGSRRKEKPLIIVNCAAIPEALLESELFGYEEGAFSGTKRGGKLGKIELAHEGTIFLDEIGDMTLSMQAKLLRVLQDREIERLGGTQTIKVDIRIIAATNRNLEKMIADGSFRQDLYYRLNIVSLFLPPLRERKEDILELAQRFLDQLGETKEQIANISPQVGQILEDYDWPGNVRELHNVMEHASILCDGPMINISHLPKYLQDKYKGGDRFSDNPHHLKTAVEKLERDLILASLAKHRDSRSKAMEELGLSRSSFYEKLHKYELENK